MLIKNDYVYVEVKYYSNNIILDKINELNINIYNVIYLKNKLIIKIKNNDYDKLIKYIMIFEIKKIKYTGLMYITKIIKQYYLILIFLLVGIIAVFLLSFFIVDIKIINNNEELIDIINSELYNNGIRKFSIKKSYEDLEIIKQKIKNNHLDKIEWIEIEKIGMIYQVKVEKRIIKTKENNQNYCNIYAKKEGLIKNIIVYNGESKININDYVKKGDLLISGDITLNDNIINSLCAKGKVYAEIWYDIKLSGSFYYDVEVETNNVKRNIVINNYKIFKDRFSNYNSEKKEIFDLFGNKIYLEKDYEKIVYQKRYTEEEVMNNLFNIARKKITDTLEEDDEIVLQKVLQKDINDSTINVEIFIVTLEQIGYSV